MLLNELNSTTAVRAGRKYHEEVVDAIDDWLVETDAAHAGRADAPIYGG